MSTFVTHDYHFHSTLSACCHDECMRPETVLAHAAEHGFEEICLTDHLWDPDVPGASSWYRPQGIRHVRSALPLPRHERVRFFFGCETEYCGGGKLGLSRAHFDEFDFVVIPTTHMHMRGFVRPEAVVTEAQMVELYVDRLEELVRLDLPWNKVGIAHLTCNLLFKEGDVGAILRQLDEARLLRVFDRLARTGAGIELNASSLAGWQADPDTWLRPYRLAKRAGCRFYSASDAHVLENLGQIAAVIPGVVAALALTERDRYRIPCD
ncbi:MAG: PHP domain-containing protein [Lentisphaerae bacterium]|nr:PHP domain-containing protein [Lentisphaerota bacterium]